MDVHTGLAIDIGREHFLALAESSCFVLIKLLITPPMVSMPRDNGVTSSNSISVVPPLRNIGLHCSAEGDHFVRDSGRSAAVCRRA